MDPSSSSEAQADVLAAAESCAAAVSTLNEDEERRARYIYLVRKTCDGTLKAILLSELQKQQPGITWEEWGKQNLSKIKKSKFYISHYVKENQCDANGVPRWDNIDTTFINSLKRHVKLLKFMSSPDIKEIVSLRNKAAHGTVNVMYQENYHDAISNLKDKISACLAFCPDVQAQLDLVEAKKDLKLKESVRDGVLQWLEHCKSEILIPKVYNRLPDIIEIRGREKELEDIEEKVKDNTLTLITGCPGIGKTMLALTFAKDSMTDEGRCIAVDFRDMTDNQALETKEMQQLICAKIQSEFPGVSKILDQDNRVDSFRILKEHLSEIIDYPMKLLIILDNVDGILEHHSNVFVDLIKELSSPTKYIKFVCTSRNRDLNSDIISIGKLTLEGLPEEVCVDWLSSKFSEVVMDTTAIKEIAGICGGIPLIINAVAARINDRRSVDMEELRCFKETPNSTWELIKWSFKSLSASQLELMQCASVFSSEFHESSLRQFYRWKLIDGDFKTDLWKCVNLSLLEVRTVDEQTCFCCHPYIQEYITGTYKEEISALHSLFYTSYYVKLRILPMRQLAHDGFVWAARLYQNDRANYEKFLKIRVSELDIPLELMKVHTESARFSYYWLYATLWYLDKQPETKRFCKSFAEDLEKIFEELKMFPALMVVKMFLAHLSRLQRDDYAAAREKLNEAFELVSDDTPPFCKGYVSYSVGRMVEEKKRRKIEIESMYSWESEDASKMYGDALEQYNTDWQDIAVEGETKDSYAPVDYTQLIRIEEIQVSSHKYRYDMEQRTDIGHEGVEIDEIKQMKENAASLYDILGNHEQCSYTYKLLADMLSYCQMEDEAAMTYEKAFSMNCFLEEETGNSYASNILILKNWARSLKKGGNPQEALKKLNDAEELLMKYYMHDHEWARRVCDLKNEIENEVL